MSLFLFACGVAYWGAQAPFMCPYRVLQLCTCAACFCQPCAHTEFTGRRWKQNLLLSRFGKPVPAVALDSFPWLTRLEREVVFCSCSSSNIVLRCYTTHHSCNSWVPICFTVNFSSSQAGHSTLTSFINKLFLPAKLLLIGYFCLFVFLHHSV